MKRNRLWRTIPRLSRSDWLWTLVPALLWYGAVSSRGVVLHPYCAEHPQACTRESLWEMDRPAAGLEVPGADGLSFATQNLSGYLALGVPPLWNAGLAMAGRLTPAAALAATGTDLVIFAQTAFTNGFFTEIARLATGRPRPFVYGDPRRARDHSNYTSFFSGHTSFSAAATVSLVLTLLGRGAPWFVLALASALSYSLVSLTAIYRILAGRHFPTDVLAGAAAGALVAWVVAYLHRPVEPSDTRQ